MKYLFKKLLIFILIFTSLKLLMYALNTGHKVTYTVGNFEIKETLKAKENEYFFILESEKEKISFKINHSYNKSEKVIKKIYHKKIEGYDCYLPIFKNKKILTDIMCKKDDIVYYEAALNNQNILEYFKQFKYDKTKYEDKASKITVSSSVDLYKDNISKNDYIALENYKGLTLFNGKHSTVKIFENDIYKKPISLFTDKYYLVADYNEEYSFKNFYVVNIINGEKKSIRSYDEISFDSYIMGTVKNDVYLFDKENQIEYKISLKNETVEQIGNKDNIKYYNGSWTAISLNEALNEKKFKTSESIEDFDKTDKIDNTYYLYKKDGNEYKVYKMDQRDKTQKIYLFNTTDLNNIIYLKGKIIYRNNTEFYYFTSFGKRLILKDTELEFNNDINLGVYEK